MKLIKKEYNKAYTFVYIYYNFSKIKGTEFCDIITNLITLSAKQNQQRIRSS